MAVYHELEFDDDNVAEIEAHRISIEQILSVFGGQPKFFRNKQQRSATQLMIGPDAGGQLLCVPIIETPVRGRWRPITAWLANETQKIKWRKAK